MENWNQPLRLATRVVKGIHVFVASGEIDYLEKQKFVTALDAAVDGVHSPLIIDLTNVRYMDSSGLNALARAKRRMSARNDELYVAVSNPHLKKLFSIVGFDKLFHVHETLDDAVTAASSIKP